MEELYTYTTHRTTTHNKRYNYYTYYFSVILSISHSSFNNNRAYYSGGAVYDYGDEEMNITHSMFTNPYVD